MKKIYIRLILLAIISIQANLSYTQKYCRVVLNAATGSKQFYLIQSNKEVPLSIGSEDELPKSVTHLVMNITNLRPNKYKYIIWNFKDEKDNDNNTAIIDFSEKFFGEFSPGDLSNFLSSLAGLPLGRGDKENADNIYENIDAVNTLSKKEVLSQINSSFIKLNEVEDVAAEFEVLSQADEYTVETLQKVTDKLLTNKMLTENLNSEDKLLSYMEKIYQEFKISDFVLSELDGDSLEDGKNRGEKKNLNEAFMNDFNLYNQQQLIEFYSNADNLMKVLNHLKFIYEFRQSLYDGSYFYTDTIELDRSSNVLYVKGVIFKKQTDEETEENSENDGTIMKIKLPTKTKVRFYYSLGLKYSFYLTKNEKFSFTRPDALSDTLFIRASDDLIAFPVIDQSFSFLFETGKVFNWGFNAYVGFPLLDQSKPTFGLGPVIALGRGYNKLFINANIGFAYQTILKSGFAVNTPYATSTLADYNDDAPAYFTTGQYAPNISIGIGFGFGGGGN